MIKSNDFKKIEEENNQLKIQIEILNEKLSSRSETGRFMRQICDAKCLPFDVQDIIKTSNSLELSLRFDYDTYESWLVVSNKEQECLILTPQIPLSHLSSESSANMAANAQRIIDCWLISLKENINYFSHTFYKKEIIVTIKDECLYANLMKWSNENNLFFHPYLIEHHYNSYSKIKDTIF